MSIGNNQSLNYLGTSFRRPHDLVPTFFESYLVKCFSLTCLNSIVVSSVITTLSSEACYIVDPFLNFESKFILLYYPVLLCVKTILIEAIFTVLTHKNRFHI